MSFITALYASRHILVATYLMALVLSSAPITWSAAAPDAVAMALELYASSRAGPLEIKGDASNCWLNWSGW